MKRSEMLSKIASVIINYNEAHCIVNRDKAMEMAETILQVQEKNGMRPPKERVVKNYISHTHTYITEIWEPER